MTNADWLDDIADRNETNWDTPSEWSERFRSIAAELRAAQLLAEKCKPFLSDLELRSAYDAYRATGK